MQDSRPTVAVVSFDFPPVYRRGKPTPTAAPAGPVSLRQTLVDQGCEVLDPLQGSAPGGVATAAQLSACLRSLKARDVDCLVVDLHHWTRIALAVTLLRELDVPSTLLANTLGGSNGVTAATAISGSIREVPASRNLGLLRRFRDTELDELLIWVRGASALQRLRRRRLMLWGGSYGADMPFSRGDPAELERLLVREVMSEQEIVLLNRARRIVEHIPQRIDAFLGWLAGHGAHVVYDQGRLDENTLRLQVALYLAARDRLGELEGEDIAAVSIKCHFEMSVLEVGCTACLLPAFLPFSCDAEGPRDTVPVACEGDLNGLAGLAMLHAIQPQVPPLFGDLAVYDPDFVLMRNCGASSVYWAAKSNDPRASLARTEIVPNMHGKSGAAVHYETPAEETITFARLFRLDGRTRCMLGGGRIVAEGGQYTDPWPHTRLQFPIDHSLLFRAAPCNHGSITRGDVVGEMEVMCNHAGIPVVRCDREVGLTDFLRENQNGGTV